MIKINETASRTVLSHLWTETFPKIVYFWGGGRGEFLSSNFDNLIILFYHKGTRYRLIGPLITLFYLICGPRYLKNCTYFSAVIADLFFYFSILSFEGPIKINKTASRTVLPHLWTELRARLGSRKTGLSPPVFLY